MQVHFDKAVGQHHAGTFNNPDGEDLKNGGGEFIVLAAKHSVHVRRSQSLDWATETTDN